MPPLLAHKESAGLVLAKMTCGLQCLEEWERERGGGGGKDKRISGVFRVTVCESYHIYINV